MNDDRFDARLQAAFVARLDAAQAPGDDAFARTMAAIDADRPLEARRKATVRPWDALAGPARFATAAAIVIVGGTVAFSTVKAVREHAVVPEASPATRITLDRWARDARRIARSGALEITVPDIAAAARGVADVARRENGAVVAAPAQVAHGIRIVVRVPAARFTSAMAALGALGTVRARSETSLDLAMLHAHDANARVDDATIAVTLRARAAAMTIDPRVGDELHLAMTRRTGITLARDGSLETPRSNHARHRLPALRRRPYHPVDVHSRSARTAT